MPQNNTDITSSPEFKEFCKNNNLEVFNLESFQLGLFLVNKYLTIAHDRIDELQLAQKNLETLHNSVVDEKYNPMIDGLKRIQKLEERLMEVASYIPVMSPFTTDDINIKTLADKWKDTRSMTTEEVMANAVKC